MQGIRHVAGGRTFPGAGEAIREAFGEAIRRRSGISRRLVVLLPMQLFLFYLDFSAVHYSDLDVLVSRIAPAA
jgi:hypothetical protein